MLNDRHLIPLKPELYNHFACPECGAERPEGIRTMVLGKQTAAEYKCHACGLAFVRDLPAGFTDAALTASGNAPQFHIKP